MLRYIALIIALSIAPAFAADLAAKKKSTTETTTETTETNSQSSSIKSDMAKKHHCKPGEEWIATCKKHDKKGEKCIDTAGECRPPVMDEPDAK